MNAPTIIPRFVPFRPTGSVSDAHVLFHQQRFLRSQALPTVCARCGESAPGTFHLALVFVRCQSFNSAVWVVSTTSSFWTSTMIVVSWGRSRSISRRAMGVSTARWMNRFNGRAPYTES